MGIWEIEVGRNPLVRGQRPRIRRKTTEGSDILVTHILFINTLGKESLSKILNEMKGTPDSF